ARRAQRRLGPVLALVLPGDRLLGWEDARVKPGTGEHGRRPGLGVPVDEVAVSEGRVGAELLGVPLLHHAEPAELALMAVEVPVMVGIAADQPVPADPVDRLYPLHDLDGKRQAGDPRPARLLVLEVEAGGWRVCHAGLGAE